MMRGAPSMGVLEAAVPSFDRIAAADLHESPIAQAAAR